METTGETGTIEAVEVSHATEGASVTPSDGAQAGALAGIDLLGTMGEQAAESGQSSGATNDAALPSGTAWGTDPASVTPAQEPQQGQEQQGGPAKSEGFDHTDLSDEQIGVILQHHYGITETSQDGFRDLRGALKERNEKIKQLEANPGGNAEEITQLQGRLKSFEALDKIVNSSAYEQEIMRPQVAALEAARTLGEQAGLGKEQIDELFNAANVMEAHRALDAMGDPTVSRVIGEHVSQFFAAKDAAKSALNAETATAQVDEWMSKSAAIAQNGQATNAAQVGAVMSLGLDHAFGEFEKSSLLAGNQAMPKIKELAQESLGTLQALPMEQQGAAIAQAHLAAAALPLLENIMLNMTQETASLKQQIASLTGASPTNNQAAPVTAAAATGAGRLPTGSAWG